MALLRRRGSAGAGSVPRADQAAIEDHLERFVASRTGVEAYLEPRTNFTQDTVVLVASTGEWTRRRVAHPKAARALAGRLGIPVYDVAATGYPKRMREWTARRKAAGETGVPSAQES
jgi:hypothetical protein